MHHHLYSYAKRLKLTDPGFSMRQLFYTIVIDINGNWLQGQRITSGTESSVKMRAPIEAVRTANTATSAVVESVSCYTGYKEAKGDTQEVVRGRARALKLREAFAVRMAKMAADTQNPYAAALAKFIDDLNKDVYGVPEVAAKKCLGWRPTEKPLTGSEWVTTVVRHNGVLIQIYDQPDVCNWIVANRPGKSGGAGGPQIKCMISGEYGPLCVIQPKIKGLPGAKGGGSALSSFNCSAWRSYGLLKGAMAPVCQNAAEAVTAAANHMLARVEVTYTRRDGSIGTRHKPRGGVYPASFGKPQPGDPVMLIWTDHATTEVPVRAALSALIAGIDTEPTETLVRIDSANEAAIKTLFQLEADPKIVEELLNVHHTGRPLPLFSSGNYYTWLISDNSRVVYRSATSGLIGDLRIRLRQYIDDMNVSDSIRPQSLTQIFSALRTRLDERFTASAIDGMLRCILQGDRVPIELANAALERCNTYPSNADDRKQWWRLLPIRCSVLKLALIRKGISVVVYPNPLDPQNLINTPIPSVIGYILAEADYVQGVAINHPQRSVLSRTEIVQRPHNVLADVLTLNTKHVQKLLKKYTKMGNEARERMEALVARLGMQGPIAADGTVTPNYTQIPDRFSQEEQDQFWIGFYRYSSWFREEKRKRDVEYSRARAAAQAPRVVVPLNMPVTVTPVDTGDDTNNRTEV